MRTVVSFLLIAALLAQIGCVSRMPVDVYPIRRPSDKIKPKQKVTAILREEGGVSGKTGVDPQNGPDVTWQTKEITGRLVSWDEKQIVIQVDLWRANPADAPQPAVFTIPVDRIDQVDRWPGVQPGPILAAIGVLAIVVAVSIGIAAAISKPKPSE